MADLSYRLFGAMPKALTVISGLQVSLAKMISVTMLQQPKLNDMASSPMKFLARDSKLFC